MRRMINIGKLNRKISLLKFFDVPDEMGQTTQVLRSVKTVWASFVPIKGNEFYELQKLESKITHKIYMRFLPEVDNTWYIGYRGKTYCVTAAIDVDNAGKLLELQCCEYTGKEEKKHG